MLHEGRLLTYLRESARRTILFCDDLSFDGDDASYKLLDETLKEEKAADKKLTDIAKKDVNRQAA